MRKTLFTLAALGLVAFCNLATPVAAHAGNLSVIQQGQGGGRDQQDATTHQNVQETYSRGTSWSTPVAYTALSGTSGSPLSITQTGVTVSSGSPSTYKGPWLVRLYASSGTVVASSLTYTAYNDASSAVGEQLTVSTYFLQEGPMSPASYLHLRGLTTTALGKYQLGTYDR